jgi:hypothetical protein
MHPRAAASPYGLSITHGRASAARPVEMNVLLFQPEQKFGKIPDAQRERVQQADPDTLLRWSGRILAEDTTDTMLR